MSERDVGRTHRFLENILERERGGERWGQGSQNLPGKGMRESETETETESDTERD